MTSAPPFWEKTGNTTWVACATCTKWFPVSGEFIDANVTKLFCPHCNQQFKAQDAAVVRRP